MVEQPIRNRQVASSTLALGSNLIQQVTRRRTPTFRIPCNSLPYSSNILSRRLSPSPAQCAFEWLEKGFQERDDLMINLKVEPAFDGLREDRRFQALVRRVGIP